MSLTDSVVNGFIQEQGGVKGLVDLFEKQGLGAIAQSWLGKGANHPVSAAQIQRALGYEALQRLGAKLGTSADQAAAELAEVLPQEIDKRTANGAARAPWDWRY